LDEIDLDLARSQHHASKHASDPRITSSQSSQSAVPARDPEKAKWVKPAHGFIKVNSDVSLAYHDHWGAGVIARSDIGVVVAACTKLRPRFNCASTTEAWGMYQAVKFARGQGFRCVHFENDNQRLVRLLQGREEEQSSYLGSLIQSIKSLLPSFSMYNLTHVKRSGNALAHCLAHLATTGLNSKKNMF